MTETTTPRHQPPSGKPVCCGHRGFKSKFPENTLLSFSSAITDANIRIIETDLQVSKDDVVLINHDVETGRTYNENYVIRETNYEPELKSLKNTSPPHEPILTFNKALHWLVRKNQEVGNVKLMLDIKRTNPLQVLDLALKEMIKVDADINYWHNKIIFGLWTLEFYEHGVENHLLDGFEIINITFSTKIATLFLNKSASYEESDLNFKSPIAGVSLLHLATWGANYDDEFIKFYGLLINQMGRKLYLWTCNDMKQVEFYCKLGISGFLTDIPDQIKDSIDKFEGSRELNLYEFYRYNDPVNFKSKQGWKNYGTYKIYKSFEYCVLKGYMNYKVPVINGGKDTVGSYSMRACKFLGII